jgi:hypothetical protein
MDIIMHNTMEARVFREHLQLVSVSVLLLLQTIGSMFLFFVFSMLLIAVVVVVMVIDIYIIGRTFTLASTHTK